LQGPRIEPVTLNLASQSGASDLLATESNSEEDNEEKIFWSSNYLFSFFAASHFKSRHVGHLTLEDFILIYIK